MYRAVQQLRHRLFKYYQDMTSLEISLESSLFRFLSPNLQPILKNIHEGRMCVRSAY